MHVNLLYSALCFGCKNLLKSSFNRYCSNFAPILLLYESLYIMFGSVADACS